MRWNSKYYMLERFKKLRAQNNDIVNRHVRAPSMIIALEIQQMREVVALLKPLEATTTELCGEHYATASKTLDHKIKINNNINNTAELDTEIKKYIKAIEESRKAHSQTIKINTQKIQLPETIVKNSTKNGTTSTRDSAKVSK
jgi:hypothetical protein